MLFLDISPSARVAGTAGAFVAIADDASALYYNPAGAAWLEGKQLVATHTEYVADIKHEYIAYVHPISPLIGVVGVSVTMLWMESMKVTVPTRSGSEGNWTGEYFTYTDYAAQGSYSKKLTEKSSTGVNLKFIRSFARGGYKINYDAEKWSVGAGFKFSVANMGLGLDYGYSDFGFLTDMHRASLAMRF